MVCPVLITEFSPMDLRATRARDNKHTHAEVLEFAKQVIPWLEAQGWIAGYAWFSFRPTEAYGTTSALFIEEGELTALGRYYASVRRLEI